MTGYGNHSAPTPTAADLAHEHSNTRFGRSDSLPYSGGHDTYGSGATGGAGWGNKSAPANNIAEYDNSELRFGSHKNTAPYSGGEGRHSSGTVGGAGWGNKTGSFGEKNDSTMGKLMEKVGHVVHNENLAEKGRAKREAQGFGKPVQ